MTVEALSGRVKRTRLVTRVSSRPSPSRWVRACCELTRHQRGCSSPGVGLAPSRRWSRGWQPCCRHPADETSRHGWAWPRTRAQERPAKLGTKQHYCARMRIVPHRVDTTFNQGVRGSTPRRPTRKTLSAATFAALPNLKRWPADRMPTKRRARPKPTCQPVRQRQRDYVILCDPKRVLVFAENPPKSRQFLAN